MTPKAEARFATAPAGLIFTDLDGTLLDHATYGFAPALPALRRARSAGVVVILCSSKTRAELVLWQERLGVSAPFISENGGAVFRAGGNLPEDLFPDRVEGEPAAVFGLPYGELRQALLQAAGELGLDLRGFGDLTDGEVAALTGLPIEEARRSRRRDFGEPFLWVAEPSTDEIAALREWLAPRGMDVVRGGRFWHLTGGCDKGRAVKWVLDAYARTFGAPIPSLALGDSENDLPMLLTADRGVLVERAGGGHLAGADRRIERVAGEGPRGWARAVDGWLEEVTAPRPAG